MTSRKMAIIIGGLAGAVLGASAAWAYTKAQEDKLVPQLSAKYQVSWQAGAQDYVNIALKVLALLRQITGLFKPL